MQPHNNILLLDALLESLTLTLARMPRELEEMWQRMPYGGPVVTRMVYLCAMMGRAQELAEEYLLNISERLEAMSAEEREERLLTDETNLGSLLYVNRKTKEVRQEQLRRALSPKEKGKTYSPRMQQVNDWIMKDARRLNILALFDSLLSSLVKTLEGIYLAEHKELSHVQDLRANDISIASASDSQKDTSYYDKIMRAVRCVESMPEHLVMATKVVGDMNTFVSFIVTDAFEIDYALRVADEYLRTLPFPFGTEAERSQPHPTEERRQEDRALAWKTHDAVIQTWQWWEEYFAQLSADNPQGVTMRKPKNVAEQYVSSIMSEHFEAFGNAYGCMLVLFHDAVTGNANNSTFSSIDGGVNVKDLFATPLPLSFGLS